jgi:CDGSH-type Zn-finger protein
MATPKTAGYEFNGNLENVKISRSNLRASLCECGKAFKVPGVGLVEVTRVDAEFVFAGFIDEVILCECGEEWEGFCGGEPMCAACAAEFGGLE